jgi:predicted O-methyltransferase YrrM
MFPKHAIGAEVGVWKGDNAARLLRRARPERLYLVDPWEHRPERARALYGGRSAGQEAMDAVYEGVLERFASQIRRGRIEVLRVRSQEASIPTLDWVWIDGDHSYEGVSADLDHYSALVRSGGILAGDDYTTAGWWGDGVVRAVDEFARAGRGTLTVVGTHFLLQLP